jgi:hypothetical protein
MAERRVVACGLWEEEAVEALHPFAKLVYLYVTTCSTSRICGLLRVTVRTIAFKTGLTEEQALTALDTLAAAGKLVRDGDLVWLPAMATEQRATTLRHFPAHVRATAEELVAVGNAAFEAFRARYAALIDAPSSEEREATGEQPPMSAARADDDGDPSAMTLSTGAPTFEQTVTHLGYREAPATIEDFITRGATVGLGREECEACWHYYAAQDWLLTNGRPISATNWVSLLVRWKNNPLRSKKPAATGATDQRGFSDESRR